MSLKVVQRISFGIIAIWLMIFIAMADGLIAVTCKDTYPFAALLRQGSIIPLMLLLMVLAAAWELRGMLLRVDCRPHSAWAFGMIFLLMVQPWVASTGWLGNRPRTLDGEIGQLILVGGAVLGAMALQVLRKEPERTLRDAGSTLLMILYLGLLPSFAILLRCRVWASPAEGAWLVVLIFLITKCSDIGGYLVGSAIGKHKLIPAISPAKSWEGLFGGVVLSAAVAVGLVALYRWVDATPPFLATEDTPRHRVLIGEICATFEKLGYLRAAMLGTALALIALVGDLFESCIKRAAQVKDSASYIPTYGGILDLMDSPCATLPAAWFLLAEVWGVV
ncbi:MAG: phosphatidate cytidylyltransferase [Phycisphaerales bacterium]|nr:phosphatidate cytidylyltransferase [Phycisphaerales bacterium]